ncbi:hypothetical protein BDR07DRAFT_1492213 [Suillus spraguei]|nr:hypothetical protein BDR07DRAFT_1492213 [Suillus spraguei]
MPGPSKISRPHFSVPPIQPSSCVLSISLTIISYSDSLRGSYLLVAPLWQSSLCQNDPLVPWRNASSNNPASPILISLQSPTPLPLTKSPSPTVTSPLSLTAGDLDTSPVLVPAPAIVQSNAFATIQLFVDLSDDQMIQALFATTFPNCTYTKATFYKHHATYWAAIKNSSDKVECAVNAGYSPAGQWNTLLAEIKANAVSLTGSNGLGSISNSDVKCHTLPPSLLPVDTSATDTGLQLLTDLTSEMSDTLALLLQNIDDMHHDTAATTNSELPLDSTSYPQIDLFSAWLNDTSHVFSNVLEEDYAYVLDAIDSDCKVVWKPSYNPHLQELIVTLPSAIHKAILVPLCTVMGTIVDSLTIPDEFNISLPIHMAHMVDAPTTADLPPKESY